MKLQPSPPLEKGDKALLHVPKLQLGNGAPPPKGIRVKLSGFAGGRANFVCQCLHTVYNAYQ
ncbi:MAG: hypothetical protein AABZ13_04360, partial [Planctomycetota bacterium]